jgi:hypothetical protein
MGIRDRPTAPRSPWQNGHTERLIGSMPIGAHELGSHAVLLITKYMLDAGAHLRARRIGGAVVVLTITAEVHGTDWLPGWH